MPKIKCKYCGYEEELKFNLSFFFEVVGGVVGGMVGIGIYAWIAYLYAGTGFAIAIFGGIAAGCVAKWVSKRFYCPKCSKNEWSAVLIVVSFSIIVIMIFTLFFI